MRPRPARPRRFLLSFSPWAILAGLGQACSGGDGATEDGAGGGASGGRASGGSSAGGTSSGGSGGEALGGAGSGNQAGTGGDDALYVIGTSVQTADVWTGYLTVVPDPTRVGDVDLSQAAEFPDEMVFASPGDGKIYVGLGSEPTIQRWVVEDGALELDDEMSLAHLGLTNALSSGKDPIHFVAEDKAYFIDAETLEVVVWNPMTMQTQGTFGLDGLDVDDDIPWVSTNFTTRDGDRLILSARYWHADDSAASVVKVAIIDTTDDSVTYATDERCGNVTYQAQDSAGNVYFGTHSAQAVARAVGVAGSPGAKTCMVRMLSGESEFDEDYYVDLEQLSGGPAGCLIDAGGDRAYLLAYEGPELTLDNYEGATSQSLWQIHGITLGNEEDTYAAVPDVPLFLGYANAFSVDVRGDEAHFVIVIESDFSQGYYYDVSDTGEFVQTLTIPGWPGQAIRVR